MRKALPISVNEERNDDAADTVIVPDSSELARALFAPPSPSPATSALATSSRRQRSGMPVL